MSAEKIIIESDIEAAYKALFAADDYITTNSIPIREWRDNSKEKAAIFAVVHVRAAERLQPNHHRYKCLVEIVCLSYIPEDKSRNSLESLYQTALGIINIKTAAQVTTAIPGPTKIVVDGIVPMPGDEEEAENYNLMIVKTDVFVTYTP